MAFHVEISAQAERDAEAILEWLLSQHTGQTGIDWFLALDDAFGSLAAFRNDVQSPLKVYVFLLKSVSSSTDENLIFTAYCSPSKPKQYMFCISATVDENLSHQANDLKGAEFAARFKGAMRAFSADLPAISFPCINAWRVRARK